MRKSNDIILRYLYKKDNGNFHSIIEAFKNSIPARDTLEQSLKELQDYIETEPSAPFIWSIDSPVYESNDEPLKARIKQKGREFIEDKILKERNTFFTKAGLYLAILGILIAIVTIFLNNISLPRV